LNRNSNGPFDRMREDESEQAYEARIKLIKFKFIEDKSALFYHENIEMERKIHDFIINKDPTVPREAYDEQIAN
jgi:hypothetical protein